MDQTKFLSHFLDKSLEKDPDENYYYWKICRDPQIQNSLYHSEHKNMG